MFTCCREFFILKTRPECRVFCARRRARPITQYVKADVAIKFYTLLEAAAERGETAIGYRQVAHSRDAMRGYGVKLNPKKSAGIKLVPMRDAQLRKLRLELLSLDNIALDITGFFTR